MDLTDGIRNGIRVEEPVIKSALAFFALFSLALPAVAQTYSLAGRNLAAACASCHGTNGASVDGMPALMGRSREYLAQSLKDFRDGRRPGTIMPQLAKGYGDAQIDMLADYLASRKDSR